MKDNNTEYFGPEFLASLASDNTPTGGAPDLAQTFAAREARDAGEDATKELPEYEQVYDDEWIQPEPQIGHRIRCCGCGLEHQMDFRIENGAVQFNAHRLDTHKPPSAEAVAWFKSIPAWNMEWSLTDDEKRWHDDILRYVENAPRNAHRPDNSAMHPDGRSGGTR